MQMQRESQCALADRHPRQPRSTALTPPQIHPAWPYWRHGVDSPAGLRLRDLSCQQGGAGGLSQKDEKSPHTTAANVHCVACRFANSTHRSRNQTVMGSPESLLARVLANPKQAPAGCGAVDKERSGRGFGGDISIKPWFQLAGKTPGRSLETLDKTV